MFICRNAEGVRGQRKAGNPWASTYCTTLRDSYIGAHRTAHNFLFYSIRVWADQACETDSNSLLRNDSLSAQRRLLHLGVTVNELNTAIFVKPQQWPAPSESIAIY